MTHTTTSGHGRGEAGAARAALLRRTLRRHAAGVTIITVPGPAGFTATSFGSVSLEPALVSFCVATAASVAGAVQRADRFAVHLLGAGDRELADRFARGGVDRFAGTACLRESGGLPVLTAAPAWLSARVVARHPAGDHVLVIGEVDAGGIRQEAPALVRHDGSYATTARLPPLRAP
ncbi:flavin reductase family protein [Streptomyces verrucosisporus]|uniref:flavin reductase family protein n=1 Tax=Streptomyces verrucosisporus TaxID=1695161 RepID=UPI0019CFCCAB|nr:flavin reductase family protein [Streptomyces verrucosisporus]MBN3932098.1 flavin reductase family protein [Streptomyces verrucosisporus]